MYTQTTQELYTKRYIDVSKLAMKTIYLCILLLLFFTLQYCIGSAIH